MSESSVLAGALLSKNITEYYVEILTLIIENKSDNSRDKLKREFIENVMGNTEFISALKASMNIARKRVDSVGSSMLDAGHSVLFIGFRLLSHGLVGVGGGVFKTVFEVGLNIDPLLGLPYYPASTLKGASRAMCESLVDADNNQGNVNKGGSSEDKVSICDVLFGTKSSIGLIVYSDAYPIGCMKDTMCMVYVGDVVTPHYYRGGMPVKSELEATPIPVLHLSIGENLVFYTVLASRSNKWPDSITEENMPEVLRKYYKQGPLFTTTLITLAALLSGFAARSGKGYNIGESVIDRLEDYEKALDSRNDAENLANIILRNVHDSIAYIKLQSPSPHKQGKHYQKRNPKQRMKKSGK